MSATSILSGKLDPAHSQRRRLSFHIFLITLATMLVYFNTLDNGFHLDDFYRVVDNPGIHKLGPIWRHFVDPWTMTTLPSLVQYRPLLPLTLSLNYYLAGDSLSGYHLGNLLLQIVASILIYFLVLELLHHGSAERVPAKPVPENRQTWVSLAVALLFAIHPVSGILVNYISSRDLLLMQVFLSASLLAYLHLRRKGGTLLRWVVVLLLLELSMLSKSNALVAPLLVFAFELTAGRNNLNRIEPWLQALPFAIVVGLHFLFTRFVLGYSDFTNVVGATSSSLLAYPLTQARLHLFYYLRNFFWPFLIRQSPLVPPANSLLDVQVLLGLVFIAITLLLAWRLRRTTPVLSFCILAYWILMIPESSFLTLLHLAVDYRPYPSSPFLFLALCLVLEKYLQPQMAAVLFVSAVVYFGGASISLNRTWRTEESLWTYSVQHGGDALAHLNLAMSIPDRSDPRVRSNLEEALRLSPDYDVAHIDLGLWLIDQGQAQAGLEHLQTVIRLNPHDARAYYWLSSAYSKLGKNVEAATASASAARFDPRNLEYQYRAALDAQSVHDYAGSLVYLRTTEQIDPNYKETLFLKGFALQMIGSGDAIAAYTDFLTRHPTHFQAEFNLAYALMTMGRYAEAIPHFQKTLALKTDYAEAHLHLSACYEKLGNASAAEKERELYLKGSS